MPNNFGKNTERVYFIFLYIFIGLVICCGTLVIVLSEYFKKSVIKQIGRSEADEIGMRLSIMEMTGYHLIVLYVCGFFIAKKFRKEPYTTHLLMLLKVWHVVIFVLSLDGFVGTWLLFKSANSVMESVELTLLRGIDLYFANPEWRIIWDSMQFNYECCGVENYKDWEKTSWVEYEYDDNGAIVNKEPSGAKVLSLTPYSCCKKDGGCLERYLNQKSSQALLENLPTCNLSSINQFGCLPIIENQYNLALYTSLVISILVFLFEVLIVFIMRAIYIHSSICSPLKKVDSEAQTTFNVSCSQNDSNIVQSPSSPIICIDERNNQAFNMRESNCRNTGRYLPPRKRGGRNKEEFDTYNMTDASNCVKKHHCNKKRTINFSNDGDDDDDDDDDGEYAPLLIH